MRPSGEAHSIAVAKRSEKLGAHVVAMQRRLDSRAAAVRQLVQQFLAGWL
jgi:hypothetical protein